ncbi:MAG TPA: BON domain-containing protein [Thermoanaerobaculia bacterium]
MKILTGSSTFLALAGSTLLLAACGSQPARTTAAGPGGTGISQPTAYSSTATGHAMSRGERTRTNEVVRALRDGRATRNQPISVYVQGDTVHLEGSVGSESQRTAAIAAAAGVSGVGRVMINNLMVGGMMSSGLGTATHGTVHSMPASGTMVHGSTHLGPTVHATGSTAGSTMTATDRSTAEQITRSMRDHYNLHDAAVSVRVSGNTVFLDGEVRNQRQRGDAIAAAGGIPGVTNIVTNLRVAEPAATAWTYETGTVGFLDTTGPRVATLGTGRLSADEEAIVTQITRNMINNIELRQQRIMVLFSNGTAILEGEIAAMSQEPLAIAAASGVRGVNNVISNLRVTDWSNPPGANRR